jgi:PKD repeat protein
MKSKFYNLKQISLFLMTSFFINLLSSQSPVANFKTCHQVISQYESVHLFDLSSSGPTMWEWNIYDSITYMNDPFYGPVVDINSGYIYSDPFSNGNNEFSQNPEFGFDLPGCYTVVLKATNLSGTSTVVKTCLITVTQIHQFNIGFGVYTGLNTDFGIITDN